MQTRRHATLASCLRAAFVALAACASPVASFDEIYYSGDERRVLCSLNLDDVRNVSQSLLDEALDRALARQQVVMLYAHAPGITWSWPRVDAFLAAVASRNLRYYKASELVPGPISAGVAISFDDDAVDAWTQMAERLARQGALATFYVTRYHLMGPAAREQLGSLAAAGHDIGAHGVNHLRAAQYVTRHGLNAYLDDEALPSITDLRNDGYTVKDFAYPFGIRTSELDRALLAHVERVRSVSTHYDNWLIVDPCPEPD